MLLDKLLLKISASTAAGAWVLIIMLISMRAYGNDRAWALGVAILGWPLSYVFCVGLCWVVAKVAASADKAALYGPAKELQLILLHGVAKWLISGVLVLYPLVALMGAIVGLAGGF